MYSIFPPGFLGFDGFDFLEGVELPAVDAGAAHCGQVPLVGGVQVERPERPGSALIGPNGINHASAAAVFFSSQEDAVFGCAVFGDAVLAANAFKVLLFDLFSRGAQMFGEKLDLRFGNPDIALFRPGTAVAAAGTFKVQSARIPCVISLQNSVLSLLRTNPTHIGLVISATSTILIPNISIFARFCKPLLLLKGFCEDVSD